KDRLTWDAPLRFGAFAYDASEDYVALHFHNAYRPDSPFDHGEDLRRSLRTIVDDIRARELKIARIGVDSWINSVAPFQSLFPQAFAASLEPTDPDNKGGHGWWGQYISRTGTLNEKRAQRLRETRQFDVVRTHGECAYELFRMHVESASAG
ncbi:MAG TPA: hypothetical protein VG274_06375, partial [Rhizomicrobium sp.]|nr:hypothetical protein [Rhizomicrobium sp.]